MNTVTITENIVWDNDMKLHEQSQEAQTWYNDNIHPMLSFSVPKEIKQSVVDRLGLTGEVNEEPLQPDTISPVFDTFGRPSKWKFYFDRFLVIVETVYMNQSVNWNLNYIKATITES
ncbi:MAG: hypothetical protein LBN93_10625 [Candidatus Symbiothrix sp.]|jgi:hypothetical protein|nr:hypothetical protein [Candidatus Symbiothrix sp.]